MRILRIAIESLASLRDAQPVIDLVAAPFADAGIIAITGPTGAGKSTILDAVCLALFGRTPRLDRKTDDVGDLMSRGAGAASIRVDLELDSGVRWRASWSVNRARGKADGKLQPPVIEIHDATTNALVASGRKEADASIATHIGLSFDQFRGVVLLSQGDFARFLQADEGARAELLEKMTGTQLYTQLSVRAFEKQRELEIELREQNARMEGKTVLDELARAALDADIASVDAAIEALAVQGKREAAERDCWRALRERLEVHEAAGFEVERVALEIGHAEPQRARIARAERAERTRDAIGDVQRARQQVAESTSAHELAYQVLQEQQVTADAVRKLLEEQIGSLDDLHERASKELALLANDAKIDDATIEDLSKAWNATHIAGEKLDASSKARNEAESERSLRAARANDTANALAQTNASTQGIEARVAELRTLREGALQGTGIQQLVGRKRALEEASTLLRAERAVDHTALARVAAETKNLEASAAVTHAGWQRALEAANAAVELCDRTLRAALQSSELERFAHLVEDGKPCPLCGSLEHPDTVRDQAHVLTECERHLEAAKLELARTQRQVDDSRTALERARAELSRAASALDAEDTARAMRRARWQVLREEAPELTESMQPSGSEALDAAAASLAKRLRELASLETDLTRQEELVRQSAAQHTQALSAHETAKARHEAQSALCTKLELEERAAEDETLRANMAASRLVIATASRLGESAPATTMMRLWSDALLTRRNRYQAADELRRFAFECRQSCSEALEALSVAPTPTPAAFVRRVLSMAEVREVFKALSDAFTALKLRNQHVVHATVDLQSKLDARDQAIRVEATAAAALATTLASQQFADEADARDALLDPMQLDTLRAEMAKLEQHRSAAYALLEHAAHRLDEQRDTAVAMNLDLEIEPAQAHAQAQARLALTLEATSREERDRGAKQNQRKLDDEARQARAEMSGAIEALTARYHEAERLCLLIGQRDGGKFRKFAQALTLDQLVLLANRRLTSIAPRYALCRQPVGEAGDVSLKLEVIDHELADERRPVATLSGGETFLVSLALALGLADLRRGRVKLGTLFIDEGFGTLDAFTLEHALATLERLQVEQRTQILLISHVGALHERIAHRIEVNRRGRGRSRLRLVGPDGVVEEAASSPEAEDAVTPSIAARSKRKKRAPSS